MTHGDSVYQEQDSVPVIARAAAGVRCFVQAGERSVPNELHVGAEALVCRLCDLLLDPFPDGVVAEVGSSDHQVPDSR